MQVFNVMDHEMKNKAQAFMELFHMNVRSKISDLLSEHAWMY
jgi:hypothetical protein